MGSESDGALWSRSEASDVSLTAAMRAVDAADAHYQRALLLTCVKKWRASYRKRRTQWKQQLLATHHAHYARLWTAFNVWRQRTIEARKRKQVRSLYEWSIWSLVAYEHYGITHCLDHDCLCLWRSKSKQRVQSAQASSSGSSSSAGELTLRSRSCSGDDGRRCLFKLRKQSEYVDCLPARACGSGTCVCVSMPITLSVNPSAY